MATQAPQQKPPDPSLNFGCGLIMILGALYGFFGIFQQLVTAKSATGWPTSPGTVTSAYLREDITNKGRGKAWTMELEYRYTVDGTEHTGTAIHLGSFPSYGTEKQAKEVEAKYREGNSVTVYYNPKDPTKAVLEPGVASAGESISLSVFLLGLVLLLGGFAIKSGFLLKKQQAAWSAQQ